MKIIIKRIVGIVLVVLFGVYFYMTEINLTINIIKSFVNLNLNLKDSIGFN